LLPLADVDGNRLSDRTDTEQRDQFEDAVRTGHQQYEHEMLNVADRQYRRTLRFLALLCATVTLVALASVTLHIVALTLEHRSRALIHTRGGPMSRDARRAMKLLW